MTPLYYSRAAFRALAALPQPARRSVRAMADTLQAPSRHLAPIRALPGGLERDLAQVAVEGVGRLVCRITQDRIDVLAIVERDHSLPPSATRIALGASAIGGAS
ncbi:MAG: hypothetical protein ACFB0Z_04825 [Candidatus Phaeomarinobacter sp.]